MGTTSANATDYGEIMIADYMATLTLEIALMSVAGGETKMGGTEFDAADYARQPVTFVVDPDNPDTLINSGGSIAFGTPLTDWGICVELRAYRTTDYGEDVLYWTLSTPVACDAGAPVSIPINELTERIE